MFNSFDAEQEGFFLNETAKEKIFPVELKRTSYK